MNLPRPFVFSLPGEWIQLASIRDVNLLSTGDSHVSPARQRRLKREVSAMQAWASDAAAASVWLQVVDGGAVAIAELALRPASAPSAAALVESLALSQPVGYRRQLVSTRSINVAPGVSVAYGREIIAGPTPPHRLVACFSAWLFDDSTPGEVWNMRVSTPHLDREEQIAEAGLASLARRAETYLGVS